MARSIKETMYLKIQVGILGLASALCLVDFKRFFKIFWKDHSITRLSLSQERELSHFQLCNFREGISQLASRFLCKKNLKGREGENIFQSREMVEALLELLKERP